MQPTDTITYKEIVNAAGISVDTARRKNFSTALRPARNCSIERPRTYFRARASTIALRNRWISRPL